MSRSRDRNSSRKRSRLRISIVGAGKVGQTLARLAHLAGYEIGDVICLSRRSAVRAAGFIGAGTAQATSRAILSPCDIILISTPDDKIPEAVRLILGSARPRPRSTSGPAKPARGRERSGRIAPVAIHTSGATSSAVLKPLRTMGTSIASCHPLQTFQSTARALTLIPSSYFCIEGDARAKLAARRLVRDIGGNFFEIPTGMKPLYHAAAVMASAGLVSLLSISLEILGKCGLDDKTSRAVLLPLIQGAVANLGSVGPQRAMTGPIPRHDLGTIERNRAALASLNQSWLVIYNLLTDRGFQLVRS